MVFSKNTDYICQYPSGIQMESFGPIAPFPGDGHHARGSDTVV